MCIAPRHNGRAFGHAQIALAQLDALAFGRLDELLDRPVGKSRIGRMRNRLLLYGGVHHHALEIFALDRPRPMRHRKAVLQRAAICSRPVAVASALATSDRTAPGGGTPLRRRSIESTGSPPTGRTHHLVQDRFIDLDAKQTGERSAGNPYAEFDVAGTKNVAWSDTVTLADERARKLGNTTSTYTDASVLDLPPTPVSAASGSLCCFER